MAMKTLLEIFSSHLKKVAGLDGTKKTFVNEQLDGYLILAKLEESENTEFSKQLYSIHIRNDNLHFTIYFIFAVIILTLTKLCVYQMCNMI